MLIPGRKSVSDTPGTPGSRDPDRPSRPTGHPSSHAGPPAGPHGNATHRHIKQALPRKSHVTAVKSGSSQPSPRPAAVTPHACQGPCLLSPWRPAVLWTEPGSHHIPAPSPGHQPLPISGEGHYMVAPAHRDKLNRLVSGAPGKTLYTYVMVQRDREVPGICGDPQPGA